MNAEWKTKWLEALRGDEYEQAVGTLHRSVATEGRGAGYCCLGVLCDIYHKEYPDHLTVTNVDNFQTTYAETEDFIDSVDIDRENTDAETTELPRGLAQFMELSVSGQLDMDKVYEFLTDHPDYPHVNRIRTNMEDQEIRTLCLIDFNDEWDWNFKQIADLVEFAL